MKRTLLSLMLAVCMLAALAVTFAAPAEDVAGRWSEEYITALQEMGIMEGYPDGSFKPTRNIKKSELVKLLNYAFGLEEVKEIDYTDVSKDKWYYEQFLKASDYVFTWDDNRAYPEEYLSREEAAAMFAKMLGFSVKPTEETIFADDDSIDDWAKDYIYGNVAKKLITGYPNDNTFRPSKNITREEIATVLYKLLGNCITEEGTVSRISANYDNVTVMTGDVTLKNLHIKGDLYLTAAVGDGTVTLEDCEADGEIIAVGNPGATLVITGDYEALQVRGDGLKIRVEGNVETLTITTAADRKADLTIDAQGNVDVLEMQTAGSVTGKVKKVLIHANGVTMTEMPEEWVLDKDTRVTIAGTEYLSSARIGFEFSTGFPTMDVQANADGTKKNVTLAFRMEEPATIYCIAVPQGSPAPTTAQICAMADYDKVKVAASNFMDYEDVTATKLMELKKLEYSKAYDLYIVAANMEDTSKIGIPVKMTIEAPFFAVNSPMLYGITEDTATIYLKMANAGTVYMLTLPTTDEAPDVEQLVKQSTNQGTTMELKADEEKLITAEELKNGALHYNIYIGVAAVGENPTEIQKFEMQDAGNTVKVSFSQNAEDGLYPIYTTLTLRFSEKVYKSGTEIQLGALGAEPAKVIGLTGKKTGTDTAVSITGATMTPVNNTILIAPPVGGWQYGTTYTLSFAGLTDIKGQTIQPMSVSFQTEKEEDALAVPQISIKSGSTLLAGSRLMLFLDTSLQKQGAIIRYTTDGSDPMTSDKVTLVDSDTTEWIDIPADAALDSTFRVRAVTQLKNAYSAELNAQYTIGTPLLKPIVSVCATGEELISGSSIQNNTEVNLSVLKTTAHLFYTLDGTDPVVGAHGDNSYKLTLSGENGTVILLKVILSYGDYTSKVYTFSYTIAEEASILPTMTPILTLRRTEAVLQDKGIYEVKGTDFLCIYSYNDNTNTIIYYTLDGSDPAKSTTRQELTAPMPGTVLQIPMLQIKQDAKTTLRLIAYNANTGDYSEERTLSLARTV